MNINVLSEGDIKATLSKNKIVLFINTSQLIDYVMGRNYPYDEFEYDNSKLDRINSILGFEDNGWVIEFVGTEYIEITFDDIEKAKEILLEFYFDKNIRKEIFVDLWRDGVCLGENT